MQTPPTNNSLVRKLRNANTPATIAVSILFLYFLVKTLYFALNIGFGVSPDETTWFGKSLVFSRYFFLPKDSPESYEYGLVTHIPYLYFWLMGKAVHLNIFAISDLVFLRLINVCIGFATLFFSWKTILMLTEKTSTRLLFLVLCTNTLMLTFLNSFVSYDNLVNFFSVASLYFLIAYFQHRSMSHLLLCILSLLLGCLTKLSFIPFALLVFMVFMLKERRNLGSVFTGLKSCFLFKNVQQSVLMLLCLFFLTLNLDLYVDNIVKFKSLSAPAEVIVGLDNAMQYRIFARGYIYEQFKKDELSLADARQMAFKYIKHEGDRNGTFYLLNIAANEKLLNNYYRIDRFRYVFPWLNLITGKVFGIMGHKSMEKTGMSPIPFMLIFILAAVLITRRFNFSDMHGYAIILLPIVIGYTLVIMQYVNYNSYHWTGAIILALQGRYLFPVIHAGYAVLAYYLTSFKSTRLNMAIATLVAFVFITSEFPWFLQHVTAGWHFAG
jgi:hypothetical protein